jgi:hypothetical protein
LTRCRRTTKEAKKEHIPSITTTKLCGLRCETTEALEKEGQKKKIRRKVQKTLKNSIKKKRTEENRKRQTFWFSLPPQE